MASPIAAFIAAAPITFLSMVFYAAFVSNLPRLNQGESVKVPWAVCVAGFLLLPVLAPWVSSFCFVRSPRTRLTLLMSLLLFVLLWYFQLGFDELLSKAWRRGL